MEEIKNQVDFYIDEQIKALEADLEESVDDYVKIATEHFIDLAMGGEGDIQYVKQVFSALPSGRDKLKAQIANLRAINRTAIATDIRDALSGVL